MTGSVESDTTLLQDGHFVIGDLEIQVHLAANKVAQMMRQPSVIPLRSYDRTWEEIEDMLEAAVLKQKKWRETFELAKTRQDGLKMKEAARNHKALDGVVKTLRWVLGEEGVEHPLN